MRFCTNAAGEEDQASAVFASAAAPHAGPARSGSGPTASWTEGMHVKACTSRGPHRKEGMAHEVEGGS